MRKVIVGFVAASVISTGFVGGFTADSWNKSGAKNPQQTMSFSSQLLSLRLGQVFGTSAARADDPQLSPVDTYFGVRDIIRRNYASPPADPKASKEWSTKLKYAAIDGMVSAVGDRYTEYWTPDEFKKNMEDTSGNFGGVGARLDVTKDKQVLIVAPIKNSPAMKAGVLPGDIIVAVDGKPAIISKEQSLDDIIKRIKGEPGTKVILTLQRKGKPKPFPVTLTRAIVASPIIESWMQDPAAKIGYIRLDMFTETADVQFDEALQELEGQGMKALIFDLRGNPGGLLHIARDLASRFIPDGPVVWTKQKDGKMDSLDVDPSKHRSKLGRGGYPVVLLVDGGSASASEIVSGAIQDAGAGFLVGTRTYGKGLVQTIIPLNEGEGAVKITTQHYFTRDKHDINIRRDEDGEAMSKIGGIHPDLTVDETEKDIEAQRAALRDKPGDRKAAAPFSPQMRRATELLRDRLAGKPFPASHKNDPDKPAPEKPAAEQ